MSPKVSVVVPTYNHAHYIVESIESALAQTHPRLEVIVVDDGSTDGTAEAIAPYRDRIQYIRQDNQGLAGARNTGFLASTGDYVAWLDSDDLWYRDKIALQVGLLEREPGIAFVASDFSAFDDRGFFEHSHVHAYYSVLGRFPGGLGGMFPQQHLLATEGIPHLSAEVPGTVRVYSGHLYSSLVFGNCLHPPTVLHRREAADRAGLLDSSFGRNADYEYLLRLSQVGQAAFIDLPLMRYRYSQTQMSSDANLSDIMSSLVRVLECQVARDPGLARNPAFRRRLGHTHLAVGSLLADQRRLLALGHVLQSLRHGCVSVTTARALVKLILPRWVSDRLRTKASVTSVLLQFFATALDPCEAAQLLVL